MSSLMEESHPASEILPLIYDELRNLAAIRMSKESGPQSLQATALVHEAYLRLTRTGRDPRWKNREHFFAAAAEAMRRIVIDRARARQRLKRGSGWDQTAMHESMLAASLPDNRLLDLNEALKDLAQSDPHAAELVNYRYFIGMTLEEVAELTKVSLSSVKRQWKYARAWLKTALSDFDH